ncbi:MAG: hypothetical protein LLF76_00015 [Planctomycetaceae bacterium]|nr:hypothetical protein [Planctomycetaceae bacterium]
MTKFSQKCFDRLWLCLLIAVAAGIVLSFAGMLFKSDLIYYAGLVLISPLLLYVLFMAAALALLPFALLFHSLRWAVRHRTARWIVISISVGVLIFFSPFKVEKTLAFQNCAANITLPLNKKIENDIIYPTELLSVNLHDQTPSIRVKLPDDNWRQFSGRQGERMPEIGYFLDSIANDKVTIVVMFPRTETRYRLAYRW